MLRVHLASLPGISVGSNLAATQLSYIVPHSFILGSMSRERESSRETKPKTKKAYSWAVQPK